MLVRCVKVPFYFYIGSHVCLMYSSYAFNNDKFVYTTWNVALMSPQKQWYVMKPVVTQAVRCRCLPPTILFWRQVQCWFSSFYILSIKVSSEDRVFVNTLVPPILGAVRLLDRVVACGKVAELPVTTGCQGYPVPLPCQLPFLLTSWKVVGAWTVVSLAWGLVEVLSALLPAPQEPRIVQPHRTILPPTPVGLLGEVVRVVTATCRPSAQPASTLECLYVADVLCEEFKGSTIYASQTVGGQAWADIALCAEAVNRGLPTARLRVVAMLLLLLEVLLMVRPVLWTTGRGTRQGVVGKSVPWPVST